jgi:amidase
MWNITGQPAASVPTGFSADGLPVAVQLVGRADDERTLLSLAA